MHTCATRAAWGGRGQRGKGRREGGKEGGTAAQCVRAGLRSGVAARAGPWLAHARLATRVLCCAPRLCAYIQSASPTSAFGACCGLKPQVVAQTVSGDPTTYSTAFLGMTNEAYCSWIRQPFNWGGGIELSILAQVRYVATNHKPDFKSRIQTGHQIPTTSSQPTTAVQHTHVYTYAKHVWCAYASNAAWAQAAWAWHMDCRTRWVWGVGVPAGLGGGGGLHALHIRVACRGQGSPTRWTAQWQAQAQVPTSLPPPPWLLRSGWCFDERLAVHHHCPRPPSHFTAHPHTHPHTPLLSRGRRTAWRLPRGT